MDYGIWIEIIECLGSNVQNFLSASNNSADLNIMTGFDIHLAELMFKVVIT